MTQQNLTLTMVGAKFNTYHGGLGVKFCCVTYGPCIFGLPLLNVWKVQTGPDPFRTGRLY